MEQADIVNTILDYVPTIDFTKTNTPTPEELSLFEVRLFPRCSSRSGLIQADQHPLSRRASIIL